MRKALALSTALCVAGVLLGCNSQSSQPAAPAHPLDEAHDAQGWALKIQSVCQEGTSEKDCVGKYGFTVLTDGHYQVGPGPQSEMRNGTLSTEEFNSINTSLSALLSIQGGGSENHATMESAAENEDTVTLTRGTGNEVVLLKTKGTDLTYRTSSADEAKSLHQAIRTLATKYYTVPFPDPCTDGAAAAQLLFESVKTCSSDSECSYLDQSLDNLAINSNQYITTDDCTILPPLYVGNTEAVKAHKTKLDELINQVKNECGSKLYRSDCTQQSGFQMNGAAPTCQQNVCKTTQTASHSNN